jgi:sterol desaturase/sphingolipid hydroxylase (fatty acid hydroxylase superfamily)
MELLTTLITATGYFLLWTLLLYVIHRAIHTYGDRWPFRFAYYCHCDHHKYINKKGGTTWHWNNLLLYNDTTLSTIDLWITEVIPTIIFCAVTGQWWIAIFYYFWAALLQEVIEHNPKFDWYPWLTSGKWHLVHHWDTHVNYGLFHSIWDTLFKTKKMHT